MLPGVKTMTITQQSILKFISFYQVSNPLPSTAIFAAGWQPLGCSQHPKPTATWKKQYNRWGKIRHELMDGSEIIVEKGEACKKSQLVLKVI